MKTCFNVNVACLAIFNNLIFHEKNYIFAFEFWLWGSLTRWVAHCNPLDGGDDYNDAKIETNRSGAVYEALHYGNILEYNAPV